MGSPAKGERGQQQGFPEKVGLGWGAVRQSLRVLEQRQRGGRCAFTEL